MRAFVLFYLFAGAAAQYDYSLSVLESVQSGSAQLSQPILPAQVSSEYSKEFYTYTVPDAEFDEGAASDQLANSLKKSLRVVFIHGPDNKGLENAALQLAKSASEDRTAIYVLSKQADFANLANQFNKLKSSNANRPEVHFIKYRTQADADAAQRTIQSQYDSLPGPTSNHNAGDAPVLDFVSKSEEPSNSFIPSSNVYLPPKRRF